MKIAFITDQNTLGGARIALDRLSDSFRASGHTVIVYKLVFFSKNNQMNLDTDKQIEVNKGNRITRLVKKIFNLQSDIFTVSQSFLEEINSNGFDFVSIHNLHGTKIDPSFIALINRPILWTFHDMWPFTGRCAYNGECTDYIGSQCSHLCPSWKDYPSLRPSKITRMQQKKQILFHSMKNLKGVCPSTWIYNRALQSGIKQNKLTIIPNTISAYMVSDIIQNYVKRKTEDVSSNKILKIGFAAQNINDTRKGMDNVWKVVNSLPFEVSLISMGTHSSQSATNKNHVQMGCLSDPSEIAQFYLNIDIFLCLSVEDNLPNTVIEAMTLGVCVIASSNTGITDVIECGKNGYLVNPSDTIAVVNTIKLLKENPSLLARICSSASSSARQNYNPNRISNLYIKQFQSLRGTV